MVTNCEVPSLPHCLHPFRSFLVLKLRISCSIGSNAYRVFQKKLCFSISLLPAVGCQKVNSSAMYRIEKPPFFWLPCMLGQKSPSLDLESGLKLKKWKLTRQLMWQQQKRPHQSNMNHTTYTNPRQSNMNQYTYTNPHQQTIIIQHIYTNPMQHCHLIEVSAANILQTLQLEIFILWALCHHHHRARTCPSIGSLLSQA